MSIVASASANIDPVGNPTEDAVVDLAVTPLGAVPAVNLYAGAVDSGDPGAVWTWEWVILAKMTGSAAAINDPTAQNILVDPIDQWGNIRLMLVATNTNTGLSSESDPLRAPSSAFVIIRVLSEKLSLQKMAIGERNWHDDAWDWVEAIENALTGAADHDIIEHDDVIAATGADLERLVGGSYALDPDSTNPLNDEGFRPLHWHYGSTINAATALARGTVKLQEAWGGGGDPLVLTSQNPRFCGQSLFSNDDDGHTPFITPHGAGFNAVFFTDMAPAHIIWHIEEACTLHSYNLSLLCAKRITGLGDYKFRLILWTTAANLDAHIYANVANSSFTMLEPSSDGKPITTSIAIGGAAIPADCWIGVQCYERPVEDIDRAYGLMVTLFMESA